MAAAQIPPTRLHHVESGQGPGLLLVHGSWGDHASWDAMRPSLASAFRVVAHDRRGFGRSRAPPARIENHVADAADLVERLGLAPVGVAGASMGGVVALRLALARPDLVRAVVVHEPPLLGLLGPRAEAQRERVRDAMDLISAGRHEEGARRFVEDVGYGPGEWDRLGEDARRGFVRNAPLWVAEMREPGVMDLDLDALSRCRARVLVTTGTRSPPPFEEVADLVAKALPHGERAAIEGARHAPHASHPTGYARVVAEFFSRGPIA